MTRELLIFRHGKLDKNSHSDPMQLALKEKSKRVAQGIGVWLSQHDLIPDLVVCSSSFYTWSSAQKCCKAMGIPAAEIQQDSALLNADGDGLMAFLSQQDNQIKRILLVAHNRGMQELLKKFGIKTRHGKKAKSVLPSGSLVHLEIPSKWQDIEAERVKLRTQLKSSSLRNGFPYPKIHSKQTRNRPAYYYNQSGVVPYRSHKGRTEILIVSSSNNKHWVIPKGIVEPGHTAQESAIKEAYEEAGVIGNVADTELGIYKYRKWGAKCRVTLYPMHVTHLLPPSAWEEKHRKRRWVSLNRAAKLLHHRIDVKKMLAPIIKKAS